MPLRLGIILLCFCFSLNSFAFQEEIQDYYDDVTVEQKPISNEDLEPYTSDKDFDYTEVEEDEENFLERFGNWLNNLLRKFWESIFGVGTASGFIYFMFRVLPYILLAVLLYLLIRFFLKVNSNAIIAKQKEAANVILNEEERIIKSEDIPQLINAAIKQKNYRLAIRYYYLMTLKLLTDTDSIDWMPQKTNKDYLNELDKEDIKTGFKNITRIYDYVWYGEFNVSDLKFETLKQPFETFNNALKQNNE
ncbi:DUF4129 domain-containing protein [Winogradskyella sp. 3972H.M.0a.05]|uniref:DUF4129 domain-containing protein n=1 Tax=Winogradskyella sp. 3972H.M.0a.05 TaxID=2950277 RepID=UPI00339109C3